MAIYSTSIIINYQAVVSVNVGLILQSTQVEHTLCNSIEPIVKRYFMNHGIG